MGDGQFGNAANPIYFNGGVVGATSWTTSRVINILEGGRTSSRAP